jgi:cytochrome c-type biogenesis protein CcmF
MGIGPMLSWGGKNNFIIIKKILPSIFLTIVMTIFIFLIYKKLTPMAVIGILLSFWIISNNLFLLYERKFNYSIGMIVAHLGVGLLILGITASSVWQVEKIYRMKIKNEIEINKYKIVFDKINEIKGPNYLALRGNFLVYDKKNKLITTLEPENRFYPIVGSFTSEASIHTNLYRDLYIVLGEGNKINGWTVRIYYNPLVIWIWIGSLIIFIGGLISMKSNLKKVL